MDQESKQFIESSFEKWTDVIKGEFDRVNGRLDKAEEDLSETKAAVFRMEHSLQERVEGQEDAFLNLEKRTHRLEDKVGLPHVFVA